MTGLGVLLNSGNESTIKAINRSIGKTIANIYLDKEFNKLHICFELNELIIFDDGQSCCETRFMVCDDNLEEFIGAELKSFSLKDASSIETQDGVHEVEFLEILTSKGPITIANHNEHNGYYGGFSIVAKLI